MSSSDVSYINKKAVAILRVSSGKQEDGFSHGVQLKYANEYCERDCSNQKLELVHVFTITESAKESSDRVKYMEAMKYISKNKIGNVIFYMQDREARNLTGLEENERKVMKGDFIIHFSFDRKCLHRKSPESDFITRAFNGLMARSYVRVLSGRVSDGLKAKAEKGWFPGNQPPLGYMCQKITDPETGQVKNRGGIIVPNPKTSPIVQREFELRAKGMSLEEIRQTIKDEGLITGKKAMQYKIAAIDNRLKNPFYRGLFMWDEVLYKGNHMPIISREHIEAVDKMIGRKTSAIRRDESDHTVLVGGWLRCTCGCNIIYDPKIKTNLHTGVKKTYHYYHCTNGKDVHADQKGQNIPSDKVWEQFGQVMDKIAITDEFAKDIAEALDKLDSKNQRVIKLQQAELMDQCQQLEKQEDTLTTLLIDGTVDKTAYNGQLKRIRDNRASLLNQLEQLRLNLDSVFKESCKSIRNHSLGSVIYS